MLVGINEGYILHVKLKEFFRSHRNKKYDFWPPRQELDLPYQLLKGLSLMADQEAASPVVEGVDLAAASNGAPSIFTAQAALDFDALLVRELRLTPALVPPRTSAVLAHFRHAHNDEHIYCWLCLRELNFSRHRLATRRGSPFVPVLPSLKQGRFFQTTATGTLTDHMDTKHDMENGHKAKQPKITDLAGFAPPKMSKALKTRIDNLVLALVIYANCPLILVRRPEFRELVTTLNATYRPPSYETLRSLLTSECAREDALVWLFYKVAFLLTAVDQNHYRGLPSLLA